MFKQTLRNFIYAVKVINKSKFVLFFEVKYTSSFSLLAFKLFLMQFVTIRNLQVCEGCIK